MPASRLLYASIPAARPLRGRPARVIARPASAPFPSAFHRVASSRKGKLHDDGVLAAPGSRVVVAPYADLRESLRQVQRARAGIRWSHFEVDLVRSVIARELHEKARELAADALPLPARRDAQ